MLQGRDYVSPDDVQTHVEPILAHRLRLSHQAQYAGRTAGQLMLEVLARVDVPT